MRSIEALLDQSLIVAQIVLSNVCSQKVFPFTPVLELRAGKRRSLVQKLKDGFLLLAANSRAYKIFKEHKIEQVVCNDFWSFWHVCFACVLLRAQILLFVRDTPEPGKDFSHAWFWPFCLSDKVISLSNELRCAVLATPFVQRFFKEDRFVVLPSLVTKLDTQDFKSAALKESFCIGYVASFRRKKQQLAFIENVIVPLRQRIANLHVIFLGGVSLGDVEYRQCCEAVVLQLGLSDCVSFVDHQIDPTPYYKQFDLVCLASTHEGLARAMLESLAQATPVVSFAVCSAHEVLVDNDCGVVVAINDYPAMVEAVVELWQDSSLRHQLGINGRQYIQSHHQADAVKKQLVGLLC